MINILRITKEMLDKDNVYVGGVNVSEEYDGSVEIEANLGIVKFKTKLWAKYSISALAGSGIKAGEGITAGWGIEAGEGIKAADGIEAGRGIEAGLSICSKWISTPLRIFAGICIWKIPGREETEIHSEIRGGTVCFGTHVPPKPLKSEEPK